MEAKGGAPQRCLTAQAAPQLSSCPGLILAPSSKTGAVGTGHPCGFCVFLGGASTPQTAQAGEQRVGCFIPELHREAGTAPPLGFHGQKKIRRRWQGAGPGFPQDFGPGRGKSRWSPEAWHGLAPGLAVAPRGTAPGAAEPRGGTAGTGAGRHQQGSGGGPGALWGHSERALGCHNMRVTTMVRKSS